jgi:hypothetical protein
VGHFIRFPLVDVKNLSGFARCNRTAGGSAAHYNSISCTADAQAIMSTMQYVLEAAHAGILEH